MTFPVLFENNINLYVMFNPWEAQFLRGVASNANVRACYRSKHAKQKINGNDMEKESEVMT